MKPVLAANLIRFTGWGFIVFGIVFVSIAFAGFYGFAHRLAALFDWTGHPHTDPLTRDARWFAAIMSGLSAGFGALYVFCVAPLLTVKNEAVFSVVRRGGLMAALIWFVIDSLGSYGAGVPSNVAMNTLFLLCFIGPLFFAKYDQNSN